MTLRPTRLATQIGLAFGSLVLMQTAALAQTLERVTITGSNIKRVEAEAPTAVQVISQRDIEKSGASTVNEVFLQLPGFSSFNDESNATGSPSRSTLGFRNFDSSNVLVLINGRRMSRNAVNGSAYDLNAIPASAIQRVEVLKDGAAAIYGSDAIAGVVNFVLKRDAKGGEVTIGYGEALKNHDGTEKRVSLSYGIGSLAEDGYNLLLTGDYFKRDVIFRRDRAPFAFRTGPGQYNEAAPTGNVSSASTGGKQMPINTCLEPLVTDQQGTYCPYYFNKQINLIPATERGGFFGSFTKKLAENHTLFAEAAYSGVDTVNYFSAPPGTFRTVPVPAGGITLANGTVLPAGESTTIRIRYDQNGVRTFIPRSDSLRFVTGVEGVVDGTDYSVDVGRSTTKTSELSTGFFDYATARADITAGTFSPWVVPTASEIAKYNVAGTTDTKTSLTFFNAKASRELMSLDGGMLAIAAGYSAGKENLSISPDEISAAGRVSATGTPVVALDTKSRNINSLYSELSIPIVKNLETQVALRYDKYNDVGSVTTPKLAAKFTVIPTFALRGSYTQGFIAPDLENLYRDGIESAEFVRDTALCKQQNIAAASCTQDQIDTSIRSNSSLKPEKSKSLAFGFIAQPIQNLSIQADWFDIQKRDRVGTSLQYLIDHPDAIVAGKKASDYIQRTPTTDGSLGSIIFADSPYFNIGKERSTGVELGLTFTTGLADLGRLTFDNQLSYFTKYTKAQAPGEPELSYLGLMDQPRFRNAFNINYDIGNYTATIYYRTIGGFLDTQEPTEVTGDTPRVNAWSTVDLQLAARNLGMKGSRLTVGVKNVFNKQPAQTNNDNNSGFPTSQNGVGRFLYLTMSVPF